MARDPQDRNVKPRPHIVFEGKRYTMPEHGEATLTFHDGQLRYIDRRTREKVDG